MRSDFIFPLNLQTSSDIELGCKCHLCHTCVFLCAAYAIFMYLRSIISESGYCARGTMFLFTFLFSTDVSHYMLCSLNRTAESAVFARRKTL